MNIPLKGKQTKEGTKNSFSLYPLCEKNSFYGSDREFLFQIP